MEPLYHGCQKCIETLIDYKELLKPQPFENDIIKETEMTKYKSLCEEFVALYHLDDKDIKCQPINRYLEVEFEKLYSKIMKNYNSLKLMNKQIILTKHNRRINEFEKQIREAKEKLKNDRVLFEKTKEKYEKKIKDMFSFEDETNEKLIKAQDLYDKARDIANSAYDIHKNLKPFNVWDYSYRDINIDEFDNQLTERRKISHSLNEADDIINDAIKILE